MKNIIQSLVMALKLVGLATLLFVLAALTLYYLFEKSDPSMFCIFFAIVSILAGFPTTIIVACSFFFISRLQITAAEKERKLFIILFSLTIFYGAVGGIFISKLRIFSASYHQLLVPCILFWSVLAVASGISVILIRNSVIRFFTSDTSYSNQLKTMETTNNPVVGDTQENSGYGNIMIKGIITAGLILAMMIPTVYISNLVHERSERHEQIAEEVRSKWATSQTLGGPYLFVPFKVYTKSNDRIIETTSHFWITPDELDVVGNVDHEIRQRSIYKVLLYRARVADTGKFILQIPKDVDPVNVQWKDARICFGLSDFKGIEERLSIHLNGSDYELSPGLPAPEITEKGLSAPVDLSALTPGKVIPFDMQLKIRGSEQLHFLPLSGNSRFTLKSTWPNPSFDGNSLPGERVVTPDGFLAKWTFNKANLPFGTLLKDFKIDDLEKMGFGVTMLQPGDQYAKTNRCVKYAILFVGLTFALFFIVELMQKKPVHPVQYILIGLALVIFYSLLLSISEFILFDYAYLIASLAIIVMITLYAKSHFKSWSSASIFCGILSVLYGFIFILIRLEDTALLVGSIGLFIVLALVMYASRRINWYGGVVNSQSSIVNSER
jgi:inner membrane protein